MIYKLNSVLPFGKYKGKTINKVINLGAHTYLIWCTKNVKDFKLSKKSKALIKRKRSINSYPGPGSAYYPGDYGHASCPGDYMGMCPEDYGIYPWGHS